MNSDILMRIRRWANDGELGRRSSKTMMRRNFLQTAALVAAPRLSGRRAELYQLLGELPARDRPIGAKTVWSKQRDHFIQEKLELDLNGIETVPAYFLKPLHLKGKAPCVLYHHYHGGKYKLGKEELLTPKPDHALMSYAEDLCKQGYCVLCADTWAFGERATHTEADLFKMFLWKGQVMWGMMVYDSIRAVDYLLTRPEVDGARVATMGMSMGSTMAWWLAALDERIKVCVDICCLTDFQELIASNGLSGHGIYYYVPGLLKHFTAAQINALIAPRAHLGLAGNKDALTPPRGLDKIDVELKRVYAEAGKPQNWKMLRYNVGHEETGEMRREVLNWLKEKL